jgi:O-antigen/teichoic acid export membrane protein
LAAIQNVNDYGQINYVIAIGSLSASISLLGLNTAVTTLLPKGNLRFGIQANQLILVSCTICAIIASFYSWILVFFVFGMSFWMMTSYELLGIRQYRKYALNVIGARGSQLILSLVLFQYFDTTGIIMGFIISFFLFSTKYISTFSKFSKEFGEIKRHFKTSLHLYSYNLSNALLLYLDKIIIAPIFGYAILGYYQLGFQFLMFFSMIPISFYQYLVPEEAIGINKNKLRLYGICLSIVLAIVLIVCSPFIIMTFFPNYISSINSMRILSLGIIPMMSIGILNSRFLSLHKTKYIIMGSAIYQCLQISLMIYLGNKLNIDGISLAVVIALSAQALALIYANVRLKYVRNSSAKPNE